MTEFVCSRCLPNKRKERWAILQFLVALLFIGACASIMLAISVATAEAQRNRVKAQQLNRPAIERAVERIER